MDQAFQYSLKRLLHNPCPPKKVSKRSFKQDQPEFCSFFHLGIRVGRSYFRTIFFGTPFISRRKKTYEIVLVDSAFFFRARTCSFVLRSVIVLSCLQDSKFFLHLSFYYCKLSRITFSPYLFHND